MRSARGITPTARAAAERLAPAYLASMRVELTPGNLARGVDLVIGVALHEAAHAVVGFRSGVHPLIVAAEGVGSDLLSWETWGFVRWQRWLSVEELSQALRGASPAARAALRVAAERRAAIMLAGPLFEAICEGGPYQRPDLAVWLDLEIEADEMTGPHGGDARGALAYLEPFGESPRRRWQSFVRVAWHTHAVLARPTVRASIAGLASAVLAAGGRLEGDELDAAVDASCACVRPRTVKNPLRR